MVFGKEGEYAEFSSVGPGGLSFFQKDQSIAGVRHVPVYQSRFDRLLRDRMNLGSDQA